MLFCQHITNNDNAFIILLHFKNKVPFTFAKFVASSSTTAGNTKGGSITVQLTSFSIPCQQRHNFTCLGSLGGAATFSIMTLSISTFSISTFSITTLSITTFSITINKSRHSAGWHSCWYAECRYAECCLCWVSHICPLCWVSSCWVSCCLIKG